MSSVWSLGICFSDVILLGNQQWHLEMWAVFSCRSGYPLHSEHQCFSVHKNVSQEWFVAPVKIRNTMCKLIAELSRAKRAAEHHG